MPKSPRERLRALRELKGLTLHMVGQKLGCSKSSVSAIERGTRAPGLSVAIAIERVFGIPSKDWVQRDAR